MSFVRHIELDTGSPLWRHLGMRDVYELFQGQTFPQLRSVAWDTGRIIKRTTPIPERCLASSEDPLPSVLTTYTTTFTLDVFIGSIWPVDPSFFLPPEWLSANYHVLPDGQYIQHEKRIDLQLNCNWGDHTDTPEAWDYFKSRLAEILRGPIVSLHIICASGHMLERIADVMADLHASLLTRLPLERISLTFEHFQQMHTLVSRRVLASLSACSSELKVIFQKELGKNIERFDDLTSLLLYAEHITHLELQMPFDLLDQPRTSEREVDIDNRRPLGDVVFPTYAAPVTRKRLSEASRIRHITFSARGRGQVHYDRLQAAIAADPPLPSATTDDLDGLTISYERRNWADKSDDSEYTEHDSACESDAEEAKDERREKRSSSRRPSTSSARSGAGTRIGSSRSRARSESREPDVPIDAACHPCAKSADVPESFEPPELSEEEIEDAQTAEFQRASYNLRLISAMLAVLGSDDVQVSLAPVDVSQETELNIPAAFKEYPLEHWFEGTEYETSGEMGMAFVERFVRQESDDAGRYNQGIP